MTPFWLQGPRFLRDKDEAWPEADGVSVADAEFIDCELKKDFVNVISAKPGVDISEALPAVKSFSSWTRLIRTTARVLMFVRLLKERRRDIIGLRVAEVRRAQTPVGAKVPRRLFFCGDHRAARRETRRSRQPPPPSLADD